MTTTFQAHEFEGGAEVGGSCCLLDSVLKEFSRQFFVAGIGTQDDVMATVHEA